MICRFAAFLVAKLVDGVFKALTPDADFQTSSRGSPLHNVQQRYDALTRAVASPGGPFEDATVRRPT
jgi:hypothetical protein